MDLKSMKRKELQSLCKKHGIAANLANSLMIEKLESILESEQKSKRKGCLKRSGESSSEILGVSQKNVTFVVEESKEVDEKPQRVSKRKSVRASTEISTTESSVTESVKRTTRSRGESSSEILGVSQKKATFVVEESKEVDEKPQKVSKRKPVRASTEISITESSVTEPVKRTTRSKGLAESVLWSPVIEKKKVKAQVKSSPENVQENVEENATRSLRTRLVTVNDNDLKGGRKRKIGELKEEIASKTVEPSRSTRSTKKSDDEHAKEDVKVVNTKGAQSRKTRGKEEGDAIKDVLPNRSKSTRSSKKLDEIEDENVDDGHGKKRRKVDNVVVESAPANIIESSPATRSTRNSSVSLDVGTCVFNAGKASKKGKGLGTKGPDKKKGKDTKVKRLPRGKVAEIEEDNAMPIAEKSGKKKTEDETKGAVVKPRSTRGSSKPLEPVAEAKETKKEKVKKQEDVSHAKRPTRGASKASEDVNAPVEKSSNSESGKQSIKKSALASEHLTTPSGKSTRSLSKNVDDLVSSPALGSGQMSGKQASEVLTESENVTSPTSRSARSTVEVVENEIASPRIETGHNSVSTVLSPTPSRATRTTSKASGKATGSPKGGKHVSTPKPSVEVVEIEIASPRIEAGHTSVSTVLSPTPSRATRTTSKVYRKATGSPKGGKHVSTPKPSVEVVENEIASPRIEAGHTSVSTVLSPTPSRATPTTSKVSRKATGGKHVSTPKPSATKSSSKPLEDVPKKNQPATEEIAEVVATEVAMTSSRRSSRKSSKGSAEEPDSHKPSKTSKISASKVGVVQKTNDDEQTSIARKSSRISSKQGITDASKSTGKKRTRETVMEGDSSMLQRKRSKLDSVSSKSLHKELPTEGKSSGSIDSSIKQLTESEALESDVASQIDPLESAVVKETEAGNILDQNEAPETGPSLLDNFDDANGMNLGSHINENLPPENDHEKVHLKGIDEGVDISVDEATETGPLESATLTETKAENILEQNNVPESKPSHPDNLDDADGLNLGIDASADRVAKTEPSESATVTEAEAGAALTETKAENILEQSNLPESMPSHLDNFEDADSLDLGFIMDAPVDDVAEAKEVEPLESSTVIEPEATEPEATVTEVSPVDEVTEVEPLESVTVTEPETTVTEPVATVAEPEAAITVTETTVAEPEAAITVTETTIAEPEAAITVTETTVTVTETTITVTEANPTETEAENILEQDNAPESRPSHLDNLVGADGLNTGFSIDATVDEATGTEPLESAVVTGPEAGNILDQNSVSESTPSQLDNLEGEDGLNLGSDINENPSPEIDLEMVLLRGKIVDEGTDISADNEIKDICKGPEEPSENILESNEASKIDDTMLYDINVEGSELEEGSEATDVYFSPCSPNLIQAASPMIEVTTFNMDSVAPAETPNTLGIKTEIVHEGNEATNIDDLPASPNAIHSGPSDVEAEAESPTQKVDSPLCLEETQKVEENTVSAKENSSSTFAKEVSENIDDKGLHKSADMSINLERGESPIGHIDELPDTVVDDVLPECSIPDQYEQIQHETEIHKEDLEILSSTQLPTNVHNFISNTESPSLEIGSQIYAEDTEIIRENFVPTEDNNSSVPEGKNSENFGDQNPSNFVDISMNIGVGDSSVQIADKISDPNIEEILPRSKGSRSNENTSVDVSLENKPVSPKNDSSFDGDGDTIMKEVNDSRQETFNYFNPSDELSKNQDESLWQQYSVSMSREATTQENISSSLRDKDDNLKEVYIEDNKSIHFDIGINLSTSDSLPTQTNESNFEEATQDESNFGTTQDETDLEENTQNESNFEDNMHVELSFEDNIQDESNFEDNTQDESNFEDNTQDEPNFADNTQNESNFEDDMQNESNFEDDTQDETNFEDNTQDETNFEDNTQDETNRYQDTFGNIDVPFTVEETWVSSSRIIQTHDSLNDTARVDQEENIEHFDQAEELRNTSVISDAGTQEVCSQGIGMSDIDNVFRDFEASISATHVTREERVISEVSKHEESAAVESENKEIDSSANKPEDEEQMKAPDHEERGFLF